MKNKFPTNSRWIRWITFISIFGIVPVLFYWFAIRPPLQQIEGFQQGISLAAIPQQTAHARVTQAVLHEQVAMSRFQDSFLARVPIVTDSEDLVQYGAILCGALTQEANEQEIQVLGVEMLNHIVSGHYVPEGSGSSTNLAAWPRLSPGRLTNPICIPMLDLPSLALQMRLRGRPSSKIFTFVESLARYSVLINVTGIDLENNNEDIVFRLKMQSYYWMSTRGQEHE
jgi:hypothetical protein